MLVKTFHKIVGGWHRSNSIPAGVLPSWPNCKPWLHSSCGTRIDNSPEVLPTAQKRSNGVLLYAPVCVCTCVCWPAFHLLWIHSTLWPLVVILGAAASTRTGLTIQIHGYFGVLALLAPAGLWWVNEMSVSAVQGCWVSQKLRCQAHFSVMEKKSSLFIDNTLKNKYWPKCFVERFLKNMIKQLKQK